MPNPLFRQSALQNLSSPEQLDQLMRITRPRAWIALCAIGVILAAALLWGVFGSLPTNVVGQGLVVREGGLFSVISYGSGILTDVADLQPDVKLRKGQVIARVSQPALGLQVDAAKADLEDLQSEQKDLSRRLVLEREAQQKARKLQQQIQESVMQAREEQLRSLRKVERAQAELLRDGLITEQRYEETHQAILAAENEIRNARNALQRLVIDQLADTASREEKLRGIESRVGQALTRLQELQLQLQLSSLIVSELDGVVVEVLARRGGTVKVGQPMLVAKFETTDHRAVIFLPSRSNVQLIMPGMPAQISPVTAKKERYGYVIGEVISVARYPATEQSMTALLQNDALVRELSKEGAPIQVDVKLVADPATKSGFKWSSDAGASMSVHSGTACTVTVAVERKRPISLIIPLLRETFGL